MPPQQLGPYRIDQSIGRGGMGTVYRGIHQETGQPAAIKVLATSLSDDPRFRERFANEIETLKKLRHPHIVQLFGYGEQDGLLFFSMELVSGRSLQDELYAGRRFQWRDVTRIGIETCGALKHAHDHGVIHRDLKPANLLLDESQHIKLSDFGIAKLFGMTHLTGEGSVMGTADYMAPEQAEGQPVTARTDLYSLGSVLYALLSGKPPFAGNNLAQVLHGVRYEKPVALGRLAPDIPAELELIIHDLLEKEPAHRVGTALAVSNRLRAMEHGLTIRPADEAEDGGDEDDQSAWAATKVEDRRDGFRMIDTPDDKRETPQVPLASAATGRSAELTSLSEKPPVEGQPEAAEQVSHVHHFTTVERQQITGDESPDASDRATLWLILIGAVIVVGAMLAGLRYAAQPPTADELYAQITQADEADRLLLVRDEMDEFLERYAEDPRSDQVQALQADVDLERRQQDLERRLRSVRGLESSSPVERLYLQALQTARSDPESAAAKLRALVHVYGDDRGSSNTVQEVVELAREQLTRLEAMIARSSEQERKLIERQLKRAAALEDMDPQAAEEIRRGIIELYERKPWAASLVEQAQSELDN